MRQVLPVGQSYYQAATLASQQANGAFAERRRSLAFGGHTRLYTAPMRGWPTSPAMTMQGQFGNSAKGRAQLNTIPLGPRGRRRRDRLGRHRHAGGDRRPRGRRLGHYRRGGAAYRRSRHHQRRQPAARRRHQLSEKIRHRGFARTVLPRSDRLVGGREQWLPALSLQRSRDHPRLRRQQRGSVRIPARARGEGHRPAAEQHRTRDRRLGAAHHAD